MAFFKIMNPDAVTISIESTELPPEVLQEHIEQSADVVKDIEHEVEMTSADDKVAMDSLESRIESLEFISGMTKGRPVTSMEMQYIVPMAYLASKNTDIKYAENILGMSDNQITGSMESDALTTIPSEGLESTIGKIGSAIFKGIKDSARWVYEVIVKVINFFKGEDKRIGDLKAKLEKAKKEGSKADAKAKISFTGSQFQFLGDVENFTKILDAVIAIRNEDGQIASGIGHFEKHAETVKSKMSSFTFWYDKDEPKKLSAAFQAAMDIYEKNFDFKTSHENDLLIKTCSITEHVNLIMSLKSEETSDETFLEKFSSFSVKLDKKDVKAGDLNLLSFDDISKIISTLEKSINSKLVDTDNLEKLSKRVTLLAKIWEKVGDGEKVIEYSADIRRLMKGINNVFLKPQVQFYSLSQSLTQNYLRYAEKSVNAHLKGAEAETGTAVATA